MPLQHYPQLVTWLKNPSPDQTPASDFLIEIATTITNPSKLEHLLRQLPRYCLHYNDIEELCFSLKCELTQLLAIIAELAIQHDHGEKTQKCFHNIANSTNQVQIRFLSAWTAFNTQQYETCIAECDAITDTFAPVYGLMGQAYLETGRIKDAIECLTTASRLLPQDATTWFQLGKAHHVSGDLKNAISAIKMCVKLLPNADEALLYLALLHAEAGLNSDDTRHALNQSLQLLTRHDANLQVATTLLKLASITQEAMLAETIVKKVMWSKIRDTEQITKLMPQLLRSLQTQQWHHLAQEILTQVTIHF